MYSMYVGICTVQNQSLQTRVTYTVSNQTLGNQFHMYDIGK